MVRWLGPAAPQHEIPLLGPIRLIYVENTGVSFGQLQDYAALVTMVGFLVTIGLSIGFRYLLTPTRWANLALGLILGGAWGNQINRLLSGLQLGLGRAYVVDFVDLGYWPVFNVADSALTIGGILYGAYLLFYQSGPGSEESSEEEPWTNETAAHQENAESAESAD